MRVSNHHPANGCARGGENVIQVARIIGARIHDRDLALTQQVSIGSGTGHHSGIAGHDAPNSSGQGVALSGSEL